MFAAVYEQKSVLEIMRADKATVKAKLLYPGHHIQVYFNQGMR